MPEIANISPTHEAIMNWLLQNPGVPLRQCADHFGYTQSWLSTVIHSDIFQAKLRERQDAVFVRVADDIPAKLRSLADVTIEKLTAQIERTEDPEFLLDTADKVLHRMGYAPSSARNGGNVTVNQQNNFTVNAADLAQARQLMGNAPAVLPAPQGAAETALICEVSEEVVVELPAAEGL